MAITREQKKEMLSQYSEWIKQSKAIILTDNKCLKVKDGNELRKKMREIGSEFHIVKNTITKMAFDEAGLSYEDHLFDGPTAIGFAYEDAPGLAKVIAEFSSETETLEIKGGYLNKELLEIDEIKALAELPPLPIMRAQLLSTIKAPATQLARVLSEPARQVAAVLKAYTEKEANEATA